jgi:hypothetical protein
VVTTVPGGQTCAGRAGQNDAPPEFYQQQYATGLAKQLKDKLSAYESAVESGDSQHIGDAAYALGAEIRDDARLVNIPRLFGCYDQGALTRLQNATTTLATTLDGLSCTGINACQSNKAEVPGLVAQAKPQERTYVEAIQRLRYPVRRGADPVAEVRGRVQDAGLVSRPGIDSGFRTLPRVPGETRADSPLHLFPQSWAAGGSCLSAATAEGAERVRVGADRVRVGAGWCC